MKWQSEERKKTAERKKGLQSYITTRRYRKGKSERKGGRGKQTSEREQNKKESEKIVEGKKKIWKQQRQKQKKGKGKREQKTKTGRGCIMEENHKTTRKALRKMGKSCIVEENHKTKWTRSEKRKQEKNTRKQLNESEKIQKISAAEWYNENAVIRSKATKMREVTKREK